MLTHFPPGQWFSGHHPYQGHRACKNIRRSPFFTVSESDRKAEPVDLVDGQFRATANEGSESLLYEEKWPPKWVICFVSSI
jgi:hypothetical protein